MAKNPTLNVTVNGAKVSITTPAGDTLRQTQAAAATPLDDLTLPQALTWIDANVNNLADARTALKHLARLVFVLKAKR